MCSQDCKTRSVTARERAPYQRPRPGDPPSQKGMGVTRELGRGQRGHLLGQRWYPRAGPGRRAAGRNARISLGTAERGSQATRGDERQGAEATPGTAATETESERPRGWPQEGGLGSETESLEQRTWRTPEVGKPIGNDRKEREPGADTNRNCTKKGLLEEPVGGRRGVRACCWSAGPCRWHGARNEEVAGVALPFAS